MSKILLTGGSGRLGTELKKYLDCMAPDSRELDILQERMLYNVDTLIHCAAYTNVIRAETKRSRCFNLNVKGTYNLLKDYSKSKFIYISSEYAHNPVNFYGWTKLWGEELVKKHPNHLIIRTSFVSRPFPYDYAFADQYTQGDYVDVIAPLIAKVILKEATGTIYVGTGRKTMFELARRTRPDILGNSVDDIKEVRLQKDYE